MEVAVAEVYEAAVVVAVTATVVTGLSGKEEMQTTLILKNLENPKKPPYVSGKPIEKGESAIFFATAKSVQ